MNAGEIVISEGGWNIHGGSPCLHGEIPAIWPAWNVQYEGNLVVQFSGDTTVTCRICEAIKDQIKRHGLAQPFQADFEGLSGYGQGEHLQPPDPDVVTDGISAR